jgi:4-hydroxybenzoate polyprenyltransferase
MLGCWFRAGRLHSLRENLQYNYLDILTHFAKNRTQVYMYLGPAIISMLIASYGIPDLAVVVPVALSIYFAALATYMYNDFTDIGVDRLNSYKRPLVSGKATKEQVLTLAMILNVIALVLAYSTNIYATMIVLAFIVLGILYSHPKTSLKEKFPHKTIVTATGGALASLFGGLAVGNMLLYVVYAALVSFAFLFIMGPIADISDLKGDRAAGRRTFPLVVGVNKTLIIMILATLAIMTSTVLSSEFLHMNTIGIFVITGICSFVIVTLRSLMKQWNSPDMVWHTRNKMKTMHLLLQLSMLIGIFQLV